MPPLAFEQVSIRLQPLPGSQWITQDPANRASLVSIKEQASRLASEGHGPLTIVGVYLNGVPLKHRVIDSVTVTVTPCPPLQGDRLEVRCIRPVTEPAAPAEGLPQLPQHRPATTPQPGFSYGLQAPRSPFPRHPK